MMMMMMMMIRIRKEEEEEDKKGGLRCTTNDYLLPSPNLPTYLPTYLYNGAPFLILPQGGESV